MLRSLSLHPPSFRFKNAYAREPCASRFKHTSHGRRFCALRLRPIRRFRQVNLAKAPHNVAPASSASAARASIQASACSARATRRGSVYCAINLPGATMMLLYISAMYIMALVFVLRVVNNVISVPKCPAKSILTLKSVPHAGKRESHVWIFGIL